MSKSLFPGRQKFLARTFRQFCRTAMMVCASQRQPEREAGALVDSLAVSVYRAAVKADNFTNNCEAKTEPSLRRLPVALFLFEFIEHERKKFGVDTLSGVGNYTFHVITALCNR